MHQAEFALESWVVVVLRKLEVVDALCLRGGRHSLAGLRGHPVVSGVLAQLVKEGWFSVARPVQRPKATIILRNVSVPTSSIISVDDGLGVDVGERLGRALFLDHKVA